MVNKETYNLIVKYNHGVKDFYQKTNSVENEILDSISQSLNSDIFMNHFKGFEGQEAYPEFEGEVLKLLRKIIGTISESRTPERYSKIVNDYKLLLETLVKD